MNQTQLDHIANFASVQHFIHHLERVGVAGLIMPNGNMCFNKSGDTAMALLKSS